MRVTKCDKCQKALKSDQKIEAWVGFSFVDLCSNCGQPIIKFLKANKLLEKDELEQFTSVKHGAKI